MNDFTKRTTADGTLTLTGLKPNCEYEISKKKTVRSQSQNAYYFGVVVPMIRQGMIELGDQMTLKETDRWLLDYFKINSEDKKTTHKYLKEKFLDSVDEDTGEILNTEPRSSKLSKAEFHDFINRCIQFAAENLYTVIPPPGTQTKISFNNKKTQT